MFQSVWQVDEDSVEWQDMVSDVTSSWPTGRVITNTKKHVALLPYSSGTTGRPKGMKISSVGVTSSFFFFCDKGHVWISHEILSEN